MKHYFTCDQPTDNGTACKRSVSYLAKDCGIHKIPNSHWKGVSFPSSPTNHGKFAAESGTIDFDADSPHAVSAANFKARSRLFWRHGG